jgi:hypothetical protein
LTFAAQWITNILYLKPKKIDLIMWDAEYQARTNEILAHRLTYLEKQKIS